MEIVLLLVIALSLGGAVFTAFNAWHPITGLLLAIAGVSFIALNWP